MKTCTSEFPVNLANPEFCINQADSTDRLFIELPKIIRLLGTGISVNPLGFNKLIRVLKYQVSHCDLNEEYKELIKQMLQFSILPALG